MLDIAKNYEMIAERAANRAIGKRQRILNPARHLRGQGSLLQVPSTTANYLCVRSRPGRRGLSLDF
jgi:hypothetical protein